VAFSIFSADDSKKISLKIFEQEMRKILKIFPNIFDQKSQKNVIGFIKEYVVTFKIQKLKKLPRL
jgi:hypothetical protein